MKASAVCKSPSQDELVVANLVDAGNGRLGKWLCAARFS